MTDPYGGQSRRKSGVISFWLISSHVGRRSYLKLVYVFRLGSVDLAETVRPSRHVMHCIRKYTVSVTNQNRLSLLYQGF